GRRGRGGVPEGRGGAGPPGIDGAGVAAPVRGPGRAGAGVLHGAAGQDQPGSGDAGRGGRAGGGGGVGGRGRRGLGCGGVARAAGLFRYMLIREAADPALSSRQRGKMVREIAAREHTDPSGRPVRLTRWTLDVWIRRWRHGGFDALVPAPRQCQPRTPPEVMELAAALKKENPARTAAQVQRIPKAQGGWAPDETTIQRMFRRTGLTALTPAADAPAFGRWEASRPNEIWTGDAMHAIRLQG